MRKLEKACEVLILWFFRETCGKVRIVGNTEKQVVQISHYDIF